MCPCPARTNTIPPRNSTTTRLGISKRIRPDPDADRKRVPGPALRSTPRRFNFVADLSNRCEFHTFKREGSGIERQDIVWVPSGVCPHCDKMKFEFINETGFGDYSMLNEEEKERYRQQKIQVQSLHEGCVHQLFP